MEKIILYGIGALELRRDVEYFLDDNYEIIGYSDTYYISDVVDGKNFFRPQDLKFQKFDWILLLSFQEEIRKNMRKYLLEQGIPSDKLLTPTMFLHRDAEKHQLDIISDLNHYKGEQGLIFGLSYSLRNICKEELNLACYDCSWPGLDLYYNFQIFRFLRMNKLCSMVEVALCVFPYYYFDYDMSRSLRQYENGQMFSIWRLNDWHNYGKLPDAHSYVQNYKMFGEKIVKFYRRHRYKLTNHNVYCGKDGATALDNIWFRNHTETVEENQRIFLQFIDELFRIGARPIMVIPPFYLKGLDQVSKQAFVQKKEKFYGILEKIPSGTGKIQIFDYTDVFADRCEFFMDLTHLNSSGAKEFTKLINKDILR